MTNCMNNNWFRKVRYGRADEMDGWAVLMRVRKKKTFEIYFINNLPKIGNSTTLARPFWSSSSRPPPISLGPAGLVACPVSRQCTTPVLIQAETISVRRVYVGPNRVRLPWRSPRTEPTKIYSAAVVSACARKRKIQNKTARAGWRRTNRSTGAPLPVRPVPFSVSLTRSVPDGLRPPVLVHRRAHTHVQPSTERRAAHVARPEWFVSDRPSRPGRRHRLCCASPAISVSVVRWDVR